MQLDFPVTPKKDLTNVIFGIDLFGKLNVVPNSNLPGIRFFVYCIYIIMWYSHVNDMEVPETKHFIPKGFELGATLS